MILAFLEDGDHVVDIIIVIYPSSLSELRHRIEASEASGGKRGEKESLRGGVFDCFPCDEEADDIVAVALDAGEMRVGIVQRERPADKADRVGVFEEAVGDVARDVWRGGLLGVAADVQATQGQHSARSASWTAGDEGPACLRFESLKWMPSMCTARGGSISSPAATSPLAWTLHKSRRGLTAGIDIAQPQGPAAIYGKITYLRI